MAPSLTGRGGGWVVSTAAEAVRRFPGPPLEDPPTSPPHPWMGAPWGERGGLPRRRLPARAAKQRAAAMPRPSTRRPCGRRDTKPPQAATGAPGEPRRADPSGGRLRAWRVPGVTIWPARSARSAAKAAKCRPVRQALACWARSAQDRGASAIRGHGQGRLRTHADAAGLAEFASGMEARRGETPVPRWLDAQRDSPAPRSGETSGSCTSDMRRNTAGHPTPPIRFIRRSVPSSRALTLHRMPLS
jgi:hypothetical protein